MSGGEAVSFGLLVVTGFIAIPVIVLAVQVACATLPATRRNTPMVDRRPGVALLVPAHNEVATIASTCRALLRQTCHGDRVVVVADNCSDETADVARGEGAEVIERSEPLRRGKGYALDFGVRYLSKAPPEVLIIVDADCVLDDGSVDKLARACAAARRPVQALYLMQNQSGATLQMRIGEFAGIVKNLVRPLGYRVLGLPCQLMGTGMAFPWSLIVRAKLATGHLVEDMKLGADLARMGAPPLYCPEARVVSEFPDTASAMRVQKTRWEHGHLGVILSDMLRLLVTAVRERNGPLAAMALDLAVPPLALLALSVGAVVAASVPVYLILDQTSPLWFSVLVLSLLLGAVVLAWLRFGRNVISAREFAFAPIYALLKIPVYVRFVTSRQVEWVRTRRKAE